MFCEHCGNMLPDKAKFCDSCGAPVQKQEAPVYTAPETAQTYSNIPTYEAQPVAKGSVSFVQAICLYFKNYVNFSGRSRRSEYWYALLFTSILSFLFGLIAPEQTWILSLALLLPNLSLSIRRLHDTGTSGWYYLWGALPIVGTIIFFIRICKDSEGDNQWGPSPKY